jgi:hypothetical protein
MVCKTLHIRQPRAVITYLRVSAIKNIEEAKVLGSSSREPCNCPSLLPRLSTLSTGPTDRPRWHTNLGALRTRTRQGKPHKREFQRSAIQADENSSNGKD